MTFEIWGIFIYLVVQVLIGIWVSRKIKNNTDFFLAGRSLGLGLATFSVFATWFGAETCIGSAGAVFGEGLFGTRADPFGYTACLLLMGALLATTLWRKKYTTLADLYRERFSPSAEKIAVLIWVPSSIMWSAAQIRAFGQVLVTAAPFPIEWGVTAAAAFVIIYTSMGGLLGDVVTDLVQGIVLIAGLGMLLAVALLNMDSISQTIFTLPAEKLSFRAPGESMLSQLNSWSVPIFGSLVAQELASRIFACRSERVAKKSVFIAASMYLFVGSIPVILGLVGHHFMTPLNDSEQFLPLLAKQLLPPVFYILFSGALISAILSTIDSSLLAISALATQNIIQPLKPDMSAKHKLWTARIMVVVGGLISYFLALRSEAIFDLVEDASTFGSAGILVTILVGLFTKWGSGQAAVVSMLVGLVSVPLAEHVWHLEAPFLFAIATSFVAFISVDVVKNGVPFLRLKRAFF